MLNSTEIHFKINNLNKILLIHYMKEDIYHVTFTFKNLVTLPATVIINTLKCILIVF